MLEERWRITLCGSLAARQGVQVITRFRTQKTGLLLAYLALNGERAHGREELAERFWPESERPLHSLADGAGVFASAVGAAGCGAGAGAESEPNACRAGKWHGADGCGRFSDGDRGSGKNRRCRREGTAAAAGVGGHCGGVAAGSYEEWVLQARELLSEQVQGALKELVGLLAGQEAWEQALLFALRWMHLNSLNEEAHCAVLQSLLTLKRPGMRCSSLSVCGRCCGRRCGWRLLRRYVRWRGRQAQRWKRRRTGARQAVAYLPGR